MKKNDASIILSFVLVIVITISSVSSSFVSRAESINDSSAPISTESDADVPILQEETTYEGVEDPSVTQEESTKENVEEAIPVEPDGNSDDAQPDAETNSDPGRSNNNSEPQNIEVTSEEEFPTNTENIPENETATEDPTNNEDTSENQEPFPSNSDIENAEETDQETQSDAIPEEYSNSTEESNEETSVPEKDDTVVAEDTDNSSVITEITTTANDLEIIARGNDLTGITITAEKVILPDDILDSYDENAEIIEAVDIKLWDANGNKWQPVEHGQTVNIEIKGISLPENNENISVVRIDDAVVEEEYEANSENIEVIETEVTSDENRVEFEAEHFTVYAIISVSNVDNESMNEPVILLGSAPNESNFIHPIGKPDASAEEISSAEDLANIATNPTGNYVLTSDIDLTEYGNWTPIGITLASAFKGKFDGQGHTISGINISSNITSASIQNPQYAIGLFGVCDGAEIKNLYLENASVSLTTTSGYTHDSRITADNTIYAGAVVGYSLNETIVFNCHSSGNIICKKSTADGISPVSSGGIIGGAKTAIISYSYNNCNVQSYNLDSTRDYYAIAGGLAGTVTDGIIIDHSYNSGTVLSQTASYGTTYAGGLVGRGSSLDVSNSYNVGGIQATGGGDLNCDTVYAGGITASFSGTIDKTYNNGTVKAVANDPWGINDTVAYAGGIAGICASGQLTNNASIQGSVTATAQSKYQNRISYQGTKTNNVTIDSYSGGSTNDANSTKTASILKSRLLYANDLGWDFEKTWEIDEGNGFPLLAFIDEDSDEYKQEFINQHIGFIDGASNSDFQSNMRWAQTYWSEENNIGSNTAHALYEIIDKSIDIATLDFGELFENNDPFKVILADYVSDQASVDAMEKLEEIYWQESRSKIYKSVASFIKYYWTDEYGKLSNEDLFYLFHYDEFSGDEWINSDFERNIEEIVYDKPSEFAAAMGMPADCIESIIDGANLFNDGIKWLNGLIDYSAEIDAYVCADSEFKAVLREMKNHLPDYDKDYQKKLGDAIDSYINYDTSSDIVKDLLLQYTGEGVKDLIKSQTFKLIKKGLKAWLKDTMSEASFGLYSVITETADKAWKISEYITKNGDLMECRVLLKANAYFEDSAYYTLNYFENELRNNSVYENAVMYDTAFRFFKETEIYSIDTVIQYLDTYQQSWFAAIKNMSTNSMLTAIEEAQINKLKVYRSYCHGNKYFIGGRVIIIACPIDVKISDADGHELLNISDGVINDCDSDIIANVIDGVKIITVPREITYALDITANDDGIMNYSITDYNDSLNKTSQTIFDEITLRKGDTYFGNIPGTDDTALKDFTLVNVQKDEEQSKSSYNETNFVPITKLALEQTNVTMYAGQKKSLELQVTPANASQKAVIWKSSDSSIATVSENGVISAITEGTTTITAISLNGAQMVDCIVTVTAQQSDSSENDEIEGISENGGSEATSGNGGSKDNKENGENRGNSGNNESKNISENDKTSNDEKTADSEDTSSNKTSNESSSSNDKNRVRIILNHNSLILGKGGIYSIKITIAPDNKQIDSLLWNSSNTKVATVNNSGTITAKKAGKCDITVSTADGSASATCKLTVKKKPIKVKKATISKKNLTLKKGKTYTLEAGFKPFNATIKNISYKSSNKKIATVSKKGVVKGKKKGACTITVTVKDKAGKSKTAKCKVTVK